MQRYRRNVVVDRPLTPAHPGPLNKPIARRALKRLTVGEEDRFAARPDRRNVPEPQLEWCCARIEKQALIIERLSECGLDPRQDRMLLADLIELRSTLEKLRQRVCGRAASQPVLGYRQLSGRLRAG